MIKKLHNVEKYQYFQQLANRSNKILSCIPVCVDVENTDGYDDQNSTQLDHKIRRCSEDERLSDFVVKIVYRHRYDGYKDGSQATYDSTVVFHRQSSGPRDFLHLVVS